ncbi:hypothetical protein ABIC28_005130 [Rhodococcus sp. PvR044]|uniref:hypothetical protein n=1 Tax=Rhodococcus sp. PvR044 TaxID=3156402 RepID=UPI00339A1E46
MRRAGFGILGALAQGDLEPPASDDYPAADRWSWFAGLYADQTWGLVAAIPEFPRFAADQLASVCRATAAETATVEEWQAINALALAGRAAAHSPSLALAWTAVLDTCTDAYDHLAGKTFGGSEAVLGAVEAVLHQHPEPNAAAFVDGALTAWTRQLDSSVRRSA